MIWLLLYIGTVLGANWAILTFGAVPVGFGLLAPAGVFFAGIAVSLRDLVQETLGKRAVCGAILVGAALSALLSPRLALASGAAFLLSELADLLVYTPIRTRSWVGAVVLSNLVGDTVDSLLFLWLAFGSFGYLAGQLVGKWEMIAAVLPVVWLARRRFAAPRSSARTA